MAQVDVFELITDDLEKLMGLNRFCQAVLEAGMSGIFSLMGKLRGAQGKYRDFCCHGMSVELCHQVERFAGINIEVDQDQVGFALERKHQAVIRIGFSFQAKNRQMAKYFSDQLDMVPVILYI